MKCSLLVVCFRAAGESISRALAENPQFMQPCELNSATMGVNIMGTAILIPILMPLALTQTNSAPQSVDWEAMIPTIRECSRKNRQAIVNLSASREHIQSESLRQPT